MKKHGERAHSKFSASGAERWFACSGSVALSEGLPDKSSPWAEEGTLAHEVLEEVLTKAIEAGDLFAGRFGLEVKATKIMFVHAVDAANFILELGQKLDAEVLVENKVYLDFIHPEMFGTYDGAVIDHFGTLHVFDYKYGAGHSVSPKRNLQMIFYGLGLAHKFHWNFKKVRLWIIQPRIKGYDGPVFWDISIDDLKGYIRDFEAAVHRVETMPDVYTEGSHCHWCKAKSICPLKREAKIEEAKNIFGPIGGTNGKKEESKESKDQEEKLVTEAEWRKKARQTGKKKRSNFSRKETTEADFY